MGDLDFLLFDLLISFGLQTPVQVTGLIIDIQYLVSIYYMNKNNSSMKKLDFSS